MKSHASSVRDATSSRPEKNIVRRWLHLLAWIVILSLLWLVVLPWVGSRPQVRARIEREKAHGINPDAMFYTELEIMAEILEELDRN